MYSPYQDKDLKNVLYSETWWNGALAALSAPPRGSGINNIGEETAILLGGEHL